MNAVTIDVDSLRCYEEIHGLPREAAEDTIFTRALPRFLELCDARKIHATLFCVGSDLSVAAHREIVRQASAAGHEIASHSFHHDYRLSTSSRASIDADLERAERAIASVTGRAPVGFRAPGYNLSEALIDALDARGYLYDSSLMPAPAYFAARAAAISLYRAKGRESRSLVGDAREFLAQKAAFQPAVGARYRPAGRNESSRALLEIPIRVVGPARVPWLGTALVLGTDLTARALSRLAVRRSGAVLELHAIDVLGKDEATAALVDAQPDLLVDLDDKVRRVDIALAAAAKGGTDTMENLSRNVRTSGRPAN